MLESGSILIWMQMSNNILQEAIVCLTSTAIKDWLLDFQAITHEKVFFL